MSESFKSIWPSGIPTTLWNYDLMRAAPYRASLPLMGIRPDWQFLLAFFFGACVISAFAWKRFRQRSFDPNSFDYHVLQELAPTQLRGTGPLRRAYVYYVFIMIAIYTGLTFFGGLIFSAINVLPVAGLQVDIKDNVLNGSSWPLTLAFALAGFTPLLKPLELTETWLRQRAHHWVGIPVRIKERTRALLNSLDKEIENDRALSKRMEENRRRLPAWIKGHIRLGEGPSRVVEKWAELEFMVQMIADKKAWPDVTVADDLRQSVERETQAAEISLENFEDLLQVNYDRASDGRGSGKDNGQEAIARHRRQLEARLKDAVAQIEQSRMELAALLTVFAERDAHYETISNPMFAEVVRRAFPAESRLNVDIWILVFLIPIFLIYAFAVTIDEHSLLGNVSRSAVTVSTTAALETLRIGTLFWIPAFVIVVWRQYVIETGRSSSEDAVRAGPGHLLLIVIVATSASAIGLAALALLWMGIIAESPVRFREILLSGIQPALPFFLSQAFGAAAFSLMIVVAHNRSEKTRSLPQAVLLGVLNATVVTAIMLGILFFWSRANCTTLICAEGIRGEVTREYGKGLLSFYRYFNLTDFPIYFVIAFMATVLLVRRRTVGRHEMSNERTVESGVAPIIGQAANASIALIGAVALMSPLIAKAGDEVKIAAADERTLVVAGFRSDAEPFSYAVGSGATRTFKGYVADFCYSIFDGSKYELVSVEVTAEDRFRRLRRSGDPTTDANTKDPQIDILCDPTTLRYNDQVISADGIFSPEIFASGVSYLLRRSRKPQVDAYLAYVKGTTAEPLTRRACEVNLLGVRDEGAAPTECDRIEAGCKVADSSTESKPQYHRCEFRNHNELVEWFCGSSKQLPQGMLLYFGDQEIIRAKVAAWNESKGCPMQEIEQQSAYYTYEPYALLMSKADPSLVQFVQRRTYEIFSHRSKANSLFGTYFPNSQMSPLVANLFLLNAIDEESKFSAPNLTQVTLPRNENQAR